MNNWQTWPALPGCIVVATACIGLTGQASGTAFEYSSTSRSDDQRRTIHVQLVRVGSGARAVVA